MNRLNNIILIGMPGCGKTLISSILAKKTGFDLIDIDFLIEKNENQKITEIFKNKGENYFRTIETAQIKNIHSQNSIISTGGGVVEREENFEILKTKGHIFYLNLKPNTIFERIKEDKTRPLLLEGDLRKKLSALYESRHKKYQKADFIINADDLPDNIINEIIEIYENKCKK